MTSLRFGFGLVLWLRSGAELVACHNHAPLVVFIGPKHVSPVRVQLEPRRDKALKIGRDGLPAPGLVEDLGNVVILRHLRQERKSASGGAEPPKIAGGVLEWGPNLCRLRGVVLRRCVGRSYRGTD